MPNDQPGLAASYGPALLERAALSREQERLRVGEGLLTGPQEEGTWEIGLSLGQEHPLDQQTGVLAVRQDEGIALHVVHAFKCRSRADRRSPRRSQPPRVWASTQALPYLGFVPDELTSVPSRVVAYLALQLSVPSEALTDYGDREHTRTDHFGKQDRLGFRDVRPADSAALASWLLDRALEHDKPMVLFHLACQWLLQEHLVRPGVTIVE